jgi:hypothetical protein
MMTTTIILASGPSMTAEDAAATRGAGQTIAISNTVNLAPWAETLYSGDPAWWWYYRESLTWFCGRRVCLSHETWTPPGGVKPFAREHGDGLGHAGIRANGNSGAQAINLAVLEGATNIVLLGFDMQHTNGQRHWHPDHPAPLGNFAPGMPELCRTKFDILAADLSAAGIRVINASRNTALTCFERMPIRKALEAVS